MAKIYGIGVGPGDSELLTIKAVKAIKKCEVIVAPSAMKGKRSIALNIAKEYINKDAEIMVLHFPMGGEEQEEKIYDAFKAVEEKLLEGKNVGFLTIGDPFVYSTYIYLLKHIEDKGYQTETIPGITSFSACASLANEPLVIGDEPLLIIPGNRLEAIKDEKNVVIMKVYKREEEILNTLEEKGFNYVCVKKAGREGQKITRSREEIINEKEYMSLIIAHRK
ncbi:precorrin-2/cobalt-factor-2 C20-methyltransferase [Clostridium acetobutylicum]|uniref:Cobalt-precorrin-2 C(20)-methyltransferase n=1 Tax=Clostridium acetobutylicum (strain ATCC 824 / DSM 792 / JCM 1419 / IAM 19013 / LMG 5710 / NBRC 13948 / NRRL B-527 / VKM B-1787 / 2291 / W) TaxID=272562 RepID=Q97JA7_CLOAB|nr:MULTISPECIES: cobalt-factor II C(20)-methyltransferase [Clostridium]AAK79347.1 Precorrin-2 methylase CobI/CbiL [Clostridium acetobutylicum ATCC 824]ADZ20430.1 cobalt-precorrin-2 C(20)-methyltransferase [Clostridium acetobutylicum EA 2018]AEI33086.1 cobalt-precorrin-2 C(20)-methyltransferase [Clostridium acetobutylicum DSM 1731]AWV81404.1 cobalt-factor II C(20)-methyltransferase [Clostridium acetobutylicum]MBC2393039.1 cobalt-factor II C(20)-methyltransferase [Clostridium acetobutylicum]